MNTSQFAFIICANNEQYYSECVRYIQDIYVPENYSMYTGSGFHGTGI